MALREVITLNESTPQLEAPQVGDSYLFPREVTIAPVGVTTGTILNIPSADALTTGGIIRAVSDSDDVSVRNLAFIHNANALATGTRILRIQQEADSIALFLDQNGNGTTLHIDAEATTADCFLFSSPKQTSGFILNIPTADALTTGKIINAVSNSADTGTRSLVLVHNKNALATGATVLEIRQDAAQRALFIDQNGNSESIFIDSESTTAATILFLSPTNTTSFVFDCSSSDNLTTGGLARLWSNSADTNGRDLVTIANFNSLATGARCLSLRQDAANEVLFIESNANGTSLEIQSSATTAGVVTLNNAGTTTGNILSIQAADALTTGSIAQFISNSSSASARDLVFIKNTNSLATDARCLQLEQNAANIMMLMDHKGTVAGSSYINFQATTAANTTNPISTLTTSGATTHHIQIEINGTKAWIPVSTNNPS